MDASSNSERVSEQLTRVADLPATSLVSEEDVKNKVVLPMLRALGYDNSDFNYERRTGRERLWNALRCSGFIGFN